MPIQMQRLAMAAQGAALVLFGAVAELRADGAVAVGTTGDVVKFGIAFGMVVDMPAAQSETEALARCRSFQAREAAMLCKIVARFSRECYAVAYDPDPGTPGAGWGVGKDQRLADERAMAMCKETAGAGRERFCRVESSGCDTRN
jgi:hypothetical protein